MAWGQVTVVEGIGLLYLAAYWTEKHALQTLDLTHVNIDVLVSWRSAEQRSAAVSMLLSETRRSYGC